jgi:phage-related protein
MTVKILDRDLRDFINSLERSAYSKTLRTIDLLKKFEHQLRMPYGKSLGGNLFELRIKGQQETRIFYTFNKNQAVLLHGFIKKTQKTPSRELKTALAKLRALTPI